MPIRFKHITYFEMGFEILCYFVANKIEVYFLFHHLFDHFQILQIAASCFVDLLFPFVV